MVNSHAPSHSISANDEDRHAEKVVKKITKTAEILPGSRLAIRTPRGRGKKGKGSLYEVRPIELLTTLFKAMEERNGLDTSQVEDVVLGCVTPVADQGE